MAAVLEPVGWELVCVAFELAVAELERVVVVWTVADELVLAVFAVAVDFDDWVAADDVDLVVVLAVEGVVAALVVVVVPAAAVLPLDWVVV